MKARKIFKGAVASLMSISLLMSGLPVTAAEVGSAASGQQTEAGDNAGGETAPEQQQTTPEENGGAESKVNENQPAETPNEGSQPQETPGTENNDTTNPGDTNQPQENPGTENDDTTNPGENDPSQENPGTENNDIENEQRPEDGEDSEKEDGEDSEEQDDQKDSEEENEEEENSEEDVQTFSLDGAQVVNGNISIDGDLSDWEEVTARTASGLADSWKVAFSPDGTTLYFCYTGTAGTEWDYKFSNGDVIFEISYADGTTGSETGLKVVGQANGVVKNISYGDVPGASAAVISEAHGNNAGPYRVEFAVPTSFLHNMDVNLTLGGTTISSAEIQKINGNAVVNDEPAVYTGITIDGNYADWAAVSKTDASCPNDAHPECLSQVAAVYDGDWFYIYIRDGKSSNASGAGTHSNGRFAITSDLGYERDIQLSTAPEVKGAEGAQVAYVGAEWEIAIPKSQLPKN